MHEGGPKILERDEKGRILKTTGGKKKGAKYRANQSRLQEVLDHMYEDGKNGIQARLERLTDQQYIAFFLEIQKYLLPKPQTIPVEPTDDEKEQHRLIIEDVTSEITVLPDVSQDTKNSQV